LTFLILQNPKDYYNEDGTFKDVKELTTEQAYAIAEISQIETETGSHFMVKFEGKLSAIEKKMRRLGMFKDVMQLEDPYMVLLREAKETLAERNGGAGDRT
jgi:hypothetical protein